MSQTVICFDTETCLFRPGTMAPELVCVTWQELRKGVRGEPSILHVNDPKCEDLVWGWLKSSDCLLAGQNVSYDLGVFCAQWPEFLPLVFAKLDRGQITCTKVRQQLLDIAAGQFRGHLQHFTKQVVDEGVTHEVKGARWIAHNYDLDSLVWRCAGRRLDKDTYRMRYGELLEHPIEAWPEGARTYPLEDARATMDVFLAQELHVEFIPDQFRQTQYQWARHLTAAWGLRTYAPGVEKLRLGTEAALADIEQSLVDAGLVRHDGSRDTKRAKARMIEVCKAAGITLRLTDKGAPSLDADACEASGDGLLEDYAELTSLKAVLNKDLPVLASAVDFPVHTSFGMAASGRSTSSKPNVQNPRRLPGIREAFVPREGHVYAQADFSALELHTLAQVCVSLFGKSHLADVLNAHIDPHTALAADIFGISYDAAVLAKKAGDERFDSARQTAKVANFGIPGGLGIEKLCLFARKSYGVKITPDEAKALKAAYLARWPELAEFFKYVGSSIDEETGEGMLAQLFSGRIRGGCHYTAACNSWFQGLGADAASRAHYLVEKACYAEPDSPLYGSRAVNFVHDEIILETPYDPAAPEVASNVAYELGRLMVKGANEFLPDVPSRTEPLLAVCWSKKAKPVYLPNTKVLVPWKP